MKVIDVQKGERRIAFELTEQQLRSLVASLGISNYNDILSSVRNDGYSESDIISANQTDLLYMALVNLLEEEYEDDSLDSVIYVENETQSENKQIVELYNSFKYDDDIEEQEEEEVEYFD